MVLAEISPALGLATIGLSTADSFHQRIPILTDLGRFGDAADVIRRGHERARGSGENEIAGWIDFWRVRLLARTGDASGALAMGHQAIESNEMIGSVLGRVMAHGHHGLACIVAGEWQRARESFDLALELGRTHQAARFLDAHFLAALAEAHRLFTDMGATGHARRLSEELTHQERRL